jgi:putative addiction module component (TIGR02574 family)
MPHSFEEVRQIAHELSEEQRLLLANSLLESVSEPAEAEEAQLAAAWDEEIARRVTEIKAGTAVTSSLDDLASDLRSIVDR